MNNVPTFVSTIASADAEAVAVNPKALLEPSEPEA